MVELRHHRARMQTEGHGSDIVFPTKTGNYIAKSGLIRPAFRPLVRKAKQAEQEAITLRTYAPVLPVDDAKLAEAIGNTLIGAVAG